MRVPSFGAFFIELKGQRIAFFYAEAIAVQVGEIDFRGVAFGGGLAVPGSGALIIAGNAFAAPVHGTQIVHGADRNC